MADETVHPVHATVPQTASSSVEADLSSRLCAGDFAAFTTAYDLYAPSAYALAYRLLHAADQAEDVVQEVLLSLWEHPDHFHPARGSLRTWVLSAAHHRAVDRLRRRATHPQTSLDGAPGGAAPGGADGGPGYGGGAGTLLAEVLADGRAEDPADHAEQAERAHAVRSALAQLPASQREAIVLAYFGGLTQQEVADHIGEPLGTVKTRIRLALAKLRMSLATLNETEGAESARLSTSGTTADRDGGNPHGEV